MHAVDECLPRLSRVLPEGGWPGDGRLGYGSVPLWDELLGALVQSAGVPFLLFLLPLLLITKN